MKQITKYILPRFVWFWVWFRQWFLNENGRKGFADQVMNHLLQRTFRLAARLKKRNTRLAECIKSKTAQLFEWCGFAVVDADEFDHIRELVHKLGWWLYTGTIAEAALNYFALTSVMSARGAGWVILRMVTAIVITGFGIYIFRRWFNVMLNKPMYKRPIAEARNMVELVLVTVLCAVYEAGMYYLSRVRGEALEGAGGNHIIAAFVILFGMLLPLVAGYLAYERSIFLSAYRNTVRIAAAKAAIAKWQRKIATNRQRMQNHFKKMLQDQWAVSNEFGIYKENYNRKKGWPKEDMAGHFGETHERFLNEAVDRYNRETVHEEQTVPIIINPRLDDDASMVA
jgi:hypothetical protein